MTKPRYTLCTVSTYDEKVVDLMNLIRPEGKEVTKPTHEAIYVAGLNAYKRIMEENNLKKD